MKVIQILGQAKLVEWTDGARRLRRSVIPVGADDPEHGIPYGIQFEQVVAAVVITPEQIADALHGVGIWTYEELRAHPNEAVGALNNITGLVYARLVNSARRVSNG